MLSSNPAVMSVPAWAMILARAAWAGSEFQISIQTPARHCVGSETRQLLMHCRDTHSWCREEMWRRTQERQQCELMMLWQSARLLFRDFWFLMIWWWNVQHWVISFKISLLSSDNERLSNYVIVNFCRFLIFLPCLCIRLWVNASRELRLACDSCEVPAWWGLTKPIHCHFVRETQAHYGHWCDGFLGFIGLATCDEAAAPWFLTNNKRILTFLQVRHIPHCLSHSHFCVINNYVTIICDLRFTQTEALALGQGARSAQKF